MRILLSARERKEERIIINKKFIQLELRSILTPRACLKINSLCLLTRAFFPDYTYHRETSSSVRERECLFECRIVFFHGRRQTQRQFFRNDSYSKASSGSAFFLAIINRLTRQSVEHHDEMMRASGLCLPQWAEKIRYFHESFHCKFIKMKMFAWEEFSFSLSTAHTYGMSWFTVHNFQILNDSLCVWQWR